VIGAGTLRPGVHVHDDDIGLPAGSPDEVSIHGVPGIGVS